MAIPVAQAGPKQSFPFSGLPQRVDLVGNATNTPIIAWEWTMLSVPPGSTANEGANGDFSNGVATIQNPYFNCDVAGDFVLQLRARNSTGWSSPETDREVAQTNAVIRTELLNIELCGLKQYRYDEMLNNTILTLEAILAGHAERHQLDGEDELSVDGLSGLLADGQNAVTLQGRDVSTATPSEGQVLLWYEDEGTAEWQPGTLSTIKTLQSAYTDGGAGPQVIDLSAAGKGIKIRDTLAGIGETLFAVQNSTGATSHLAVNSDGAVTMAGALTVTGVVIGATPTLSTHLTTKGYVDGLITGLNWKAMVRLASTVAGGNVTLSGDQSVDGFTTTELDRVLLKNQTNHVENGIWIAHTGAAWTRAADMPAGSHGATVTVFVDIGTINEDVSWFCLTDKPNDIVGTHALSFQVFSNTLSMHNALTGLDGGTSGQYYHLTSAEYTGLHGIATGGVTFASATGVLATDANNLYWDNVNKKLGIGTDNPALGSLDSCLTVVGFGTAPGYITSYRTSAAIEDVTGFYCALQNDGDDPVAYSFFGGEIVDPTAGSEYGRATVSAMAGGTLTPSIFVNQDGIALRGYTDRRIWVEGGSDGADLTIEAGPGFGNDGTTGGALNLRGGSGTSSPGGEVNIYGGASDSGTGGTVSFTSGDGALISGNLSLQVGSFATRGGDIHIGDGSNLPRYITIGQVGVTTTIGGDLAVTGALGLYTYTAGETLAQYDVVYAYCEDPSGTPSGQLKKATNAAESTSRVVGVVVTGNTAGNAATVVMAGVYKMTFTGTAPAIADFGKPVYLSATAGAVTLTAPGAGTVLLRVGYLVGIGAQAEVSIHVGDEFQQ